MHAVPKRLFILIRIQTVPFGQDAISFQFLLSSYPILKESERETVEEISGLFTLAGCGLLVFISFGPGATLLKLMNTYYPELDLELLAKHPLCSCLFYLYLIIQTEQ